MSYRIAPVLASSPRVWLPVLVSALLLPLVALASPASAQTAVGYERQVVTTTNAVRHSHHMRDLRPARCLTRFAEKQARAMADKHQLFHQDLRVPVRRCGLRHVGENVAVGYPDGRTVVRLGWMKSAGHRANILTKGYRRIAVGAHQDASGRWWTAQLFSR
ncbi:MAG: CAP domain-containing protein [Jiangellaceae bacterium]